MSKFKIGDIVLVNQDTINIEGSIIRIEKGFYNKENGTYTLDKYYVSPTNYLSTDLICSKKEITLKKKEHTMTTSNLDKNNANDKKETLFYTKHNNVVVVGIRTEEKEIATKEMKSSVKVKGRTINGTFTAKYTKPLRRFVIGYSICHSDDEFDMNIGIEVAKKRALHKPAGELRSNNWTMLQDGQCEMIVKCEAEYIFNNIKKYIDRR